MKNYSGMPCEGRDRASGSKRASAKGKKPDPINPGEAGAAGHEASARKRQRATASGIHPRKGEGADIMPRASAKLCPPPFDGDTLRALVSTRRTWQQVRNRLHLHALALCRSACAGDKGEAVKLYKATAAGDDARLHNLIGPMLDDIARWDARIAPLEKQIVPLIMASPIGSHIAETKGLGGLSVATLIGMTGPLDQIRSVNGLSRYCGLAVFDGKREPLVEPGKADRRPVRAAVYVIAAGVIKAGNPELRAIYDREKAKALGKEWTKARSHNHAMRYLGRFIIRRMWKVWRASK